MIINNNIIIIIFNIIIKILYFIDPTFPDNMPDSK